MSPEQLTTCSALSFPSTILSPADHSTPLWNSSPLMLIPPADSRQERQDKTQHKRQDAAGPDPHAPLKHHVPADVPAVSLCCCCCCWSPQTPSDWRVCVDMVMPLRTPCPSTRVCSSHCTHTMGVNTLPHTDPDLQQFEVALPPLAVVGQQCGADHGRGGPTRDWTRDSTLGLLHLILLPASPWPLLDLTLLRPSLCSSHLTLLPTQVRSR